MSFIKLNQQKINYQQQERQPDDTFILSDIVDSTISPEYPKIIRTTDELAIYFGTNWDQYNYYVQLLSSGISLLLYKPLLGNQETESFEIKNVDGYPDDPKEGILYSIGDGKYYIYHKDSDTFIDQDNLPENSGSPENSPSWQNRDTLGISRTTSSYYPKFSNYLNQDPQEEEKIKEITFLEKSKIKQSLSSYGDPDENVTFSFLLDFTNVNPKDWKNYEDDVYIVFSKAVDKINSRFSIFWMNNHFGDESTVVEKMFPQELVDNQAPLYYFYNYSKSQILKDIASIISSELGFYTKLDGETIVINSPELLRINSYSNIPNLVMTPIETSTKEIIDWGLQGDNTSTNKYYKLSQSGNKIYYTNLPSNYLEFYSRLLGKSLDPITITIKKVNNLSYQVTISKLNYSEVYYGRFDTTFIGRGINNIEAEINKNSKLVYCKVDNCYSVSDNSLVTSDISDGSWQLSGGEIETILPRNRWNALKVLEGVNIQEDFLLIPDIQKWRYIGVGDFSYYPEYSALLNYAETKNCQILIQNNPIVQVKQLENSGVTYYLGKKILNGEVGGEIKQISELVSQSISYDKIKLTPKIEISVDSGMIRDLKSSGLTFSGKNYNISKIKINNNLIVNSDIAISQESDYSLESDRFTNLKVGDKITIETTTAENSSPESTLTTAPGKVLKSKEVTGFKVGDTLFNSKGSQLLEKVSSGESFVNEVVKVNNNFYKVSEDNVVSEVNSLTVSDNLVELTPFSNKLLQLSEGYIINSSGLTISSNTRKIDYSPKGDKIFKIDEKLINNSGKTLSSKFETLSTLRAAKPIVYKLSEKYYNASTQEETDEREYALPWGNDFYFNYTGDSENRLIYFFKDFQVEGLYKRPGYYYFLRGILFNNWEIDKVIYDHDEEIEETELGKQLQLKKSNYISLYNNSYHYKKFFWDTTGNQDYYCSGTLKYCQSRLSRLFEKYKWRLLGFQKEGEMRSFIQNILNSVKERHSSLVHSLSLEDLQINNNRAEIRLLLRTKEFIEKDIKLNVTLNYIY